MINCRFISGFVSVFLLIIAGQPALADRGSGQRAAELRQELTEGQRVMPFAQGPAASQRELQFIQHLMDRQFWDDALFAIRSYESGQSGLHARSSGIQDSLNFWAGWAAYHRQQLPQAINRLGMVSAAHPSHVQAGFYRSWIRAYLAVDYHDASLLQEAGISLESVGYDEDIHRELRDFQLAGMALIQRDFNSYSEYARTFSGRYFAMAQQQQNLNDYMERLLAADRKSPFAAAAMSAVIPGSGKIYAGRRGSGISSFLQVAVFGGIFAESYLRSGPKHARTIVSGSAFGLFYIANIWGSAVAVKITKEEIYEEVNQHILFDLHIPLRSVFR